MYGIHGDTQVRRFSDQELDDVTKRCEERIRSQRAGFEDYELLHAAQAEIQRRARLRAHHSMMLHVTRRAAGEARA